VNAVDPVIRTKYTNTWYMFRRRYHIILDRLVDSDFNPAAITSGYDWNPDIQNVEHELLLRSVDPSYVETSGLSSEDPL